MNLSPLDEHNRMLLSQTHPPDWVQPTPAPRYNLVVLGGGTAGLVAAVIGAGLGGRVALVERALLGGDCLNFGCVPSKTLIRAARAAAAVREAHRFGIRTPGGVEVDFGAVMERVRQVRAAISPHDGAARMKSLGIDVFLGEGRFTAPDTLTVGDSRLVFHRAVLATGARAVIPDVPGLADSGYLTHETIFNLTTQPRHLGILGGGPIGCELAQALARLGSRVTLFHRHACVLDKEDAAAAEVVQRALGHDGVDLRLGVQSLRVQGRVAAGNCRIEWGNEAVAVDALLVATGRRPALAGLGLEAAGVMVDPAGGLVIDDTLRTTNPRIYASGDVCSRHQFTHAADFMSRLAVQNALFLGRRRASRLTIPRVTYTDPEIATVGLTESEAAASGVAVSVFRRNLADVDRARTDGETEGFVKLLVAAGTDRIVGATLVAPHAGDMIGEVGVAMAAGLGLGRLADVIHPYPTVAEAIRQCGDQFKRTRLTPRVQSLLRGWLAWRL